tara:strand:- start:340 stop:501 length:162 start_codon:yes stop_codon:yes gene_type:complete
MISHEFRLLLKDLSTEEIFNLHRLDPYFLDTFCYMITLEIQSELEYKNRKNYA